MHLIFDPRGPLDVSTSPDGDRSVVVHLRDTGTGDCVDLILDSPEAMIRLGHRLKTDGRQVKSVFEHRGEAAITRAMSERREKIVNDPFLPASQ